MNEYMIPIEIISDENNLPFKLQSQKLNIIFAKNSEKIVYNFLSESKSIISRYLNKNFQIGINLSNIDINMYIYLIDSISDAYDIIQNSSKTIFELFWFDNSNTIYISIFDGIMFDYPFTLDKIIYLPLKFINSCYKSKNNHNLIKIIIHELIHISQRSQEFLWEKYIVKMYPQWIKIYPNNNIFILIENYINSSKIFVTNPDTFYNHFKYIFIESNLIYYGHFVHNTTHKINIEYFQIDIENNNFQKITNNSKIPKGLTQDHIYEICAYAIAEQLILNHQLN